MNSSKISNGWNLISAAKIKSRNQTLLIEIAYHNCLCYQFIDHSLVLITRDKFLKIKMIVIYYSYISSTMYKYSLNFINICPCCQICAFFNFICYEIKSSFSSILLLMQEHVSSSALKYLVLLFMGRRGSISSFRHYIKRVVPNRWVSWKLACSDNEQWPKVKATLGRLLPWQNQLHIRYKTWGFNVISSQTYYLFL